MSISHSFAVSTTVLLINNKIWIQYTRNTLALDDNITMRRILSVIPSIYMQKSKDDQIMLMSDLPTALVNAYHRCLFDIFIDKVSFIFQ